MCKNNVNFQTFAANKFPLFHYKTNDYCKATLVHVVFHDKLATVLHNLFFGHVHGWVINIGATDGATTPIKFTRKDFNVMILSLNCIS